jgi:hypothetical protein
MKTSTQKRLMRLSGVFLLSLLVVVITAQAAQAAQASGTQNLGGVIPAPQEHQALPATGAQAPAQPLTQVPGGQSTAPGTSSSTPWIVGGAVAVIVLAIGAWALLRRRRTHATVRACEMSPQGC